MKQVIIEYAGAAIAVLGAISMLNIIGAFFLGEGGVFATLIRLVLGDL